MKKRIIPCIFLKDGFIIRSEGFKIHQIIGNPVTEIARYSQWSADEIIYIDISKENSIYDFKRSDHKYKDDLVQNKFQLIKEISKHCFSPLSFGGGIRTIDEIGIILSNGADKVILNTILFKDELFLQKAKNKFGSQALIACVDYKEDGYVYHSGGEIKTEYKILEWCKILEKKGIGEILIQSINRDGKGNGFDLINIDQIVKSSSVPIICLGGAGDYFDFTECFEYANPSAVAAGNFFHFKEMSYYYCKENLKLNNINIRLQD